MQEGSARQYVDEHEWVEPHDLPEPVIGLVDLVERAGRPGRYHDFADGTLYEVLLGQEGDRARTRVAARVDCRDFASFVGSAAAIVAAVVS